MRPFWSLLGRSWALLGRSWGRLGASWAAPGPFLGVILVAGRSLFPAIWEVLLEAWPGACKKDVVWLFFCVVVCLFSSHSVVLSCLPRGAPGRNANIENSLKHNGFYDEFAWVAFLRQVQREQISEHRRTQNCKKNTCRNSPRDVRNNCSKIIVFAPKMIPKLPFRHSKWVDFKLLFDRCWTIFIQSAAERGTRHRA